MSLARICSRPVRRVVAVAALLIFAVAVLTKSKDSPKERNPARHAVLNRLWAQPSDERHQPAIHPSLAHPLMNATFVSLVRNGELQGMLQSIRDVEERFNHAYHYPWIFLNDEDFTDAFKAATAAAVSGRAMYGKVGAEHWGYPDGIDKEFAAKMRQQMADDPFIPYGASESYRHMCRFQSGFFYRQPLVLEYDWYWRVEPGIELFCDIPSDPFRYLAENGKKYGFVISSNELKGTVPTLWTHVKAFMKDYPQHISKDNHLAFLSEDGGENWSWCHFWDNFEIASLQWFRSEAYNDFFTYLDTAGGFFYERWGDASVHSLAAALMMAKGEIHFFNDIGYHHPPYKSCPRSASKRTELNCRCKAEDNIDWNPSCLKRFFEVSGSELPDGYSRDYPPEPGVFR